MRITPAGRCLVPALVSLFAVSGLAAPAVVVERNLVNGWELHDELTVAKGTESAVKDYFPSFLEYQDLVMFHPKFGYYGSGRVSFTADYQTFPNVLSPYFGHMIAEHIFRMWRGMRKAGTLSAHEPFTIAEFGAGNGSLAESILDYLATREKARPDPQWREFAAQVVYACYDRSPALSKAQRERNARFGKRFEAREADATDPVATIPAGSLKGVVLSNELPDAFSVHKVIIAGDGTAEVGFVAPSMREGVWEQVRGRVPAAVAEKVEQGDTDVRKKFFPGNPGRRYLTRGAFIALLEAMVPLEEYNHTMQALEFNELYVPAGVVPELSDHLRRYARTYAAELVKDDRGVVTYINLGLESFVQGAGHILGAGYVLTLDYGSNWEGIIAQDAHPHFRTYGPAHTEQNTNGDGDGTGDADTSDPYRGPTLNDMTTDVNFSLMSAEGRVAGLTTVYYGAQAALIAGTAVSLNDPPPQKRDAEELVAEYLSWVDKFHTDGNYKLMVQQKEKTDSSYTFPGEHPERLVSDQKGLSDAQRQRAAVIEKRLSGTRSQP